MSKLNIGEEVIDGITEYANGLELRAAAERLTDGRYTLADWQGPTGDEADMRAGIVLARHYLRSAPADAGEVVTNSLIELAREAVGHCISFYQEDGHWYAWVAGESVRIRGGQQLQQLCAGLGAPLK